ncbi:MAG: sugar ABC transporter substrate-binding protein [Alphaproteobacteria bacterium]|nr:MAG: sugar ABC transporter substrate-binding protein [Alphaproteobacteria bacterium]
MNNIIGIILVAGLLLLNGCSQSDQTTKDASAGKVIKLWVAPEESQEAFWKIVVERWNKSGLGLPVEFKTIPAVESSEKAILTALVADNAPDISTNIFSGFSTQLAGLGQLQDLSVMDGYQELVSVRHMETIMQDWDQNGKKYVFPLYSNPTLIWWRRDILQRLGITKIPETYDDVYALSKQYAASDNKYGMQIMTGKIWYDRWFDFISFYYAASNGKPYVKDGRAVYNNEAGLAVLTFMETIYKNGWTALDFESDDPLTTGLVVGGVRGPWSISFFERMYPDTLKKIVVGPMITKHKGEGKTFTLADSKGLVIFKSSKVKEAAFDFISWVFSNDEISLLWLEKTSLPPARGDLMDNVIFKRFYDTHPMARQYASYVNVAIPSAFTQSTIDVQKTMGFEMIDPVKFGIKTPKEALADAIRRTDKILQAEH